MVGVQKMQEQFSAVHPEHKSPTSENSWGFLLVLKITSTKIIHCLKNQFLPLG